MDSSSNSSSFVPDDEMHPRETSSGEDRHISACWPRRGHFEIPKKVSEVVRQELTALTGLQASVIDLLYTRFRLLAKDGFMNYRAFKRSLGMMALLDETFLPERLFKAFDVREDGVLDFMEWCASLGIMMKGSEDERLEFSFRILRSPGKGVLRRGNSLKGPLWQGVQHREYLHQAATWEAVYGTRAAKAPPPSSPPMGSTPLPRGSRSWVTYFLATDPTDPSNVITYSEFLYIVRALENTRSQLTTDVTFDRIPDAVIQDVFDRACQLSMSVFPQSGGGPDSNVLTLGKYKAAVTQMPEFLEVLGIPGWSSSAAGATQEDVSFYKTPKSARRLLSDPGGDANDIALKVDLMSLVKLINRANSDNTSLQSYLSQHRTPRNASVSQSANLYREPVITSLGGRRASINREYSTPEESPPQFHHQEVHGITFQKYSRALMSNSDERIAPPHLAPPLSHRYISPEAAIPSGTRVRRIGQATCLRQNVYKPSKHVKLDSRPAALIPRANTPTTDDQLLHAPASPGSTLQYASAYSEGPETTNAGLIAEANSSKQSTPSAASISSAAESSKRCYGTAKMQNALSRCSYQSSTPGSEDQCSRRSCATSEDSLILDDVFKNQSGDLTEDEVRLMAYKIIHWIERMVNKSRDGQKEKKERMFVNATNFSVLKSYKVEQVTKKIPRRPRRRRMETKILDVGGRKGLVVHFGHRSWNLVLNMMLGIRMAAFRCLTERPHEIDSYDFLMKETFCVLPRVSNIIDKVRKHNYEIVRFIDYAPMVFRRLRDLDDLNGYDYLDSVGPEKLLNNIVLGNLSSLSELYTEGKSGSIFYYTNDGRFIVKTIDTASAKLLRGHILRSYYEHINSHRDSLIIRIYGFHALKIQLDKGNPDALGSASHGRRKIRKLYFIVMKNIFHTNCVIHRRYDLKGSWIGRNTLAPDGTMPRLIHQPPANSLVTANSGDVYWDPTISLKDIDIMKLKDYVKLAPADRDRILRILEADSLWLSKMHLIDYSLLVGIHVNSLDDRFIIPPTVPIKDIAAPTDAVGNAPSNAANAVMSTDKTCQYFFGIVDILTIYNNTKRFEHFIKSITSDHNGISCVKPTKYQDRFQKFMERVFIS